MKEQLTFEALLRAYYDCRRRKRNKETSLEFELELEKNLNELYEDLVNGTYKIGKSICFVITDPKNREVWAASFRDRIVHHLIYNAISKRFYSRFIKDSYSCIPDRGTMYGSRTLQNYARAITDGYSKDFYYLKADIKNFFVSINRDILYRLVCRYVEEEWLLKLLHQVIYNDCRENCILHSSRRRFSLIPPHKSMWNAADNKGLPIGNLTSQFFSNVYLNELDQYIKHHWHCKYYCRYVDDFVIFDESAQRLNAIHKDLTRFLKEHLDLELHRNKKSINKIVRGVDFVGFVLKPNRITMRQKTIKRMFKRIREYKNMADWYERERIEEFVQSMNSYLGLLRNIKSYNLRKKICMESINLFIECDEEYTKLIPYYKVKNRG